MVFFDNLKVVQAVYRRGGQTAVGSAGFTEKTKVS